MGIPKLLEESFAVHGRWQGLSFGWVAAGWLTHILSEADHRMNHAQPWAARQKMTLSTCTGQPVRALDFSDDRLSIVLRTLSDDGQWADFESRLNRNLLRVYALQGRQVRIDTTTCSGYWLVRRGCSSLATARITGRTCLKSRWCCRRWTRWACRWRRMWSLATERMIHCTFQPSSGSEMDWGRKACFTLAIPRWERSRREPLPKTGKTTTDRD